MGHISGNLLFRLKGRLQPIHHTVEGICQLMQFILSLIQLDPLLQILSLLNTGGCLYHLLNRAQKPACQKIPARKCQ